MKQVLKEMAEKGEKPPQDVLEKIWDALVLSNKLDPECEETKYGIERVSEFLRVLPPPDPPKEVASADFDVLVVGGGAAGIGCALILTETFGVNKSRVVVMERGAEVGESFRRWPEEMRFISPSFNIQGWTSSFDLNSISKGSSVAFSLHSEHPSGVQYASYLSAIVKTKKMNVRLSTEVVSIRAVGTKDLPLFSVDVRCNADEKPVMETLSARYIVWAAGEFQYPRASSVTRTNEDSTEGEEKKDEKRKN